MIRFLSKFVVLKVDLLQDLSNILFAGVYGCTFVSPEILQAWGSEGVNFARRSFMQFRSVELHNFAT